MANNYLQFSEAIIKLSTEERDWLDSQLETVCVFGDQEFGEDDIPENLADQDPTWRGLRAYRDLPDIDSDDDDGFQHEFREDDDLGRYLWLFAEEGGDPERVAHLVQKFLRQFRPKESWSLTYATTCSKLRLGEFGGGAVFVTASGIESMGTDEFVCARRAAFAG